ncbi:MAG: lactate/malate family dehydrogenase [Actinomycetota bacterium]
MNSMAQRRIAVVGAGNTGASFAYTLLLSGVHGQILVVDPEIHEAEEQALELQQAAVFFQPHEVRAAAISELSQASITVFCGVRRRPGDGSDVLLGRNLELLREAMLHIKGKNPEAIILLGAPSVELLTYAAWRFSELPRTQVIGTGTIAETATLRYLLGRHFNLDAHSVHAYVLGGNGDRVPVWSSATIAGMYIQEVCRKHGCPPAVLQSIFNEVRDRTANTEAHADAASLSTGAGLARLAAAILANENHVFSVATVLDHEFGMNDTVISVPAVIGAKGIDRILRVELNDDEVARLLACGEKTRSAIATLDLAPRCFASSEVY